jgi:hypothetical protein
MTAVVEQVTTCALPQADGRSWLRWAIAVFAGVETVHLGGGTLANDWEGWGTFFANAVFVVVTGVVIVGLTYGLLVRWALKMSPRRQSRAALATGLLSVASYVAFFTWAPILIAPGALLLARAGLVQARAGSSGRASAAAGAFLAFASLAVFVVMLTYAAFHDGNYPWIFGG